MVPNLESTDGSKGLQDLKFCIMINGRGSTDGCRGPQDLKFCIMINGRGSTEYMEFAIGGPRLEKVENRCSSIPENKFCVG